MFLHFEVSAERLSLFNLLAFRCECWLEEET